MMKTGIIFLCLMILPLPDFASLVDPFLCGVRYRSNQ